MVNPYFCQQELEAKISLIPVTINTSIGMEVLSGFAKMKGTVGRDSCIKTGSIYFFQHICFSNTTF